MADETSLSQQFQEKEFWKCYMHLRSMLLRRSAHLDLVERLRSEEAIADPVKDLVVRAINTELAENRKVLSELLENFITASMSGLHTVDVEFVFTMLSQQTFEVHKALLIVDGREEAIPADIGHRFATGMVGGSMQPLADAVREFYQREELRYDALLGGSLERCSLQILEELFPVRCYHIRIRLPAAAILENHLEL